MTEDWLHLSQVESAVNVLIPAEKALPKIQGELNEILFERGNEYEAEDNEGGTNNSNGDYVHTNDASGL